MDKEAHRRRQQQIRAVLNQEWDPIGGCPADEYYDYADRITSMINRGASDDELMRYLEISEVDTMGLGAPFDEERGRKVVAALRALE